MLLARLKLLLKYFVSPQEPECSQSECPVARNERGAAALIAFLLLPVLLVLCGVAIDVSAWRNLREKLQTEADRLSFQAAQLLPRVDLATQYLKTVKPNSGGLRVSVEPIVQGQATNAIGVRLSAQYQARFSWFLSALGKESFTARASAVSQLVPGDYVLIFPDSASLRPKLLFEESSARFTPQAFGSEAEYPPSTYFDCALKPVVGTANALGWSWWESWDEVDFQRWFTQACFNPVFSPLKLTVIETLRGLNNTGNRLALLSTPGSNTADTISLGYRVLRSLHSEREDPELYAQSLGGYLSPEQSGAQAKWGDYRELDLLLGDEACMLMAQEEFTRGEYSLPILEPQSSAGCELSSSSPCGLRHHPFGYFSECFLRDSLSLEQAVYWTAAKLAVPGFSARARIRQSLERAKALLLEQKSENSIALDRERRGNLSVVAKREILLFADLLSESDIEENFIAGLAGFGIRLSVLYFEHEGLSSAESRKSRLALEKLKTLAERYPANLKVLEFANPGELRARGVEAVLGDAKETALRS